MNAAMYDISQKVRPDMMRVGNEAVMSGGPERVTTVELRVRCSTYTAARLQRAFWDGRLWIKEEEGE